MVEADECKWGSNTKEEHDGKGDGKVPIETSPPQR
jgi:hypothetical protein